MTLTESIKTFNPILAGFAVTDVAWRVLLRVSCCSYRTDKL